MQTKSHLVRRALAAGVDYGLLCGLFWAYVITCRPKGFGVVWLVLGVWILLLPLMEGITGFTLGKGLFGLQVVDSRGRKASIPMAFMRHSLDIIDFSSSGIVAMLAVVLSPMHQRLGDLFAKTRVISDSEAKTWRSISEISRSGDERSMIATESP
jgi:uncharacterized RDD family membrane protein YckC